MWTRLYWQTAYRRPSTPHTWSFCLMVLFWWAVLREWPPPLKKTPIFFLPHPIYVKVSPCLPPSPRLLFLPVLLELFRLPFCTSPSFFCKKSRVSVCQNRIVFLPWVVLLGKFRSCDRLNNFLCSVHFLVPLQNGHLVEAG